MSPPGSFLRYPARFAQVLAVTALGASILMACGSGVSPLAGDGGTSSSGASGSSSGASGSSSSSGTSGIGGGRVPAQHRAVATACVPTTPPENTGIPDGGGGFIECHSNAECTAGRNGRCDGNGHDGYRCTYDQCYSDGECAGTAGVCACSGASRATNNVCIDGDCRVDADCGGGSGYCSPTLGSCGHYGKAVGYFCHRAEDECIDDADCGSGSGSGGQPGYCAYDKAIGHWKCSTTECVGQRTPKTPRTAIGG